MKCPKITDDTDCYFKAKLSFALFLCHLFQQLTYRIFYDAFDLLATMLTSSLSSPIRNV